MDYLITLNSIHCFPNKDRIFSLSYSHYLYFIIIAVNMNEDRK